MLLQQYHDHYNSHGDGSDADTVTDAPERQRLDTDELSESGGLRNSLNLPSVSTLIVSSMPCISINCSPKTMVAESDE